MSRSPLRSALAVAAVALAVLLPVATASAAAPAADGLLLISDGGTGRLYTVQPDGTALTQVTHVAPRQFAGDGTLSPDGRRMAFVIYDRNGFSRLYAAAPDGTARHRVFAESAAYVDRWPSFTPDNRHLVFSRCTSDYEQCAIHSVGLDGSGLTALTRFAGNIVDFRVDAGPDGRLAFERYNAAGVISQVYVAAADGSDARAITPPRLEAYSALWSPAGDRLMFGSNSSRLGGDVYTTAPTGQDLQRLTRTAWPLFVGPGAYAPSGSRIAVISNVAFPDRCCRALYTMRPDGSDFVRVPIDPDQIARVSWAPAAG